MLSDETSDILGICVVTTVALAVLVWIMSMLRRSPFTPGQSFLYALNYVMARVLWRVEVDAPFPVPRGQGALIVCNHRCPFDPSVLVATTTRVIHWMVAKEYCEFPPFRRLLSMCEVIPVARGVVDMAAIREAIRLLQQGEVVGLFPEGSINTTKELLLPGRPGAALMAWKAKAPVVPCYISGTPYDGTTLGCLFMPAHVRLSFGKPLDPLDVADADNERDALHELTRRFLRAIAEQAGQPDYEPRLVGRSRDRRTS